MVLFVQLLLSHLAWASTIPTTSTTPVLPVDHRPKAMEHILPDEIANLPILKMGENLTYAERSQLKAYPLVSNSLQSNDEPLYWITNGTHVSALATYRYNVNLSIGGLAWTSLTISYYGSGNYVIGYFSANGFGTNVGAYFGGGTCDMNYGVQWLVANKWGANPYAALIAPPHIPAGGGGIWLRGASGEDIGFCGLAGGGAILAAGPLPWGHFN
jgi:hypothetical protein